MGTAVANGFESRVTVVAKRSIEVDLPDKVDVVVSDLRGILPLLGDRLPSIIDARTKVLRPGGALIPRRDHVYAALACAEDLHPSSVVRRAGEVSGFDFTGALDLSTRNWAAARRSSLRLDSEPALLGTIDYDTIEPDYGTNADFQRLCQAAHERGIRIVLDLVINHTSDQHPSRRG